MAAVAVVATAGGAAAAAVAVASVANGVAFGTTATTVAAGAFVGSATALAVGTYVAASESNSLEEFAEHGESVMYATMTGSVIGGTTAYSMAKQQNISQCSSQCFVAGTLVQTVDGAKPIEAIRAGDMVWAWDEETGEVALKPVVETYINQTYELVHVFVNGEEIVATPSHPFYSPVKGWMDAVRLRAGDILVLVNGEYVVVEKVQHEILESPVAVYNFQVADYHTYYVTESSVLVHNKCDYNHGDSVGTSKAPKQGDNGSTYTQISSDGRRTVCSQTTYNEYCMPGTRVDYNHTHGSVGAPHVHTFFYADIDGTIRRIDEIISPL